MSKPSGTILITGGTLGLGYYAAISAAKARPQSTIVVASRKDTDNAASKISQASGNTNVVFMPLDLSSLANVRDFAKTWKATSFAPIQTLFLNAGLQFPGQVAFNDDGIEKTFAVNHVGHALLFHLLADQLAEDARIIVTSSGTHDPAQKTRVPDAVFNTAEELAHPDPATAPKNGVFFYSSSKLANVLWTYALHRHIDQANKKWTVAAFDPGLMPGTGLIRDYPPFLRFVWFSILPRILPIVRFAFGTQNVHTAQESGAALAWVGTDASVATVHGKYFEGRKAIPSSEQSYDVDKQVDLWQWTTKHIAGKDGAEAARFNRLET